MPNSIRYRSSIILIVCSLSCILISIFAGTLSAFYYVPSIADWLQGHGLSLANLRPIHTSFATAWVCLAAIAAIYFYLDSKQNAKSAADKLRFRLHMILWGLAGLAILITVSGGVLSGKEYIGFHPLISLLILAGWLLACWNFFARSNGGFFNQPVYIYMWTIGLLFFVYTFIEAHTWLLSTYEKYPVAAMQIQWKSAGSLVASFNLLIYGALSYMSERINGDTGSAHSYKTFSLFFIGLLNSFTNYTHHTYHLPQRESVKWIGFIVSMLEIIILLNITMDILRASRQAHSTHPEYSVSLHFIEAAKKWMVANIFVAILISFPPINALIHGTTVVFAHAMGSMVGIDSILLFAFIAFIAAKTFPTQLKQNQGRIILSLRGINIFMGGLFVFLVAVGITTGWNRYIGNPTPEWGGYLSISMACFATFLCISFLAMIFSWLKIFKPGLSKSTQSS